MSAAAGGFETCVDSLAQDVTLELREGRDMEC
jgi:hypothetical protein